MSWTIARLNQSNSFPRLADRSGLGSLTEKIVQLPGSDGRDQGIVKI
jgi:hypothetical protein